MSDMIVSVAIAVICIALVEVLGVIYDVVRLRNIRSLQLFSPCTTIGKFLYEESYEKEIQIALLESKRGDITFCESLLSDLSVCQDAKDLIKKALEHTKRIFPYAVSSVVIAEPGGKYTVRLASHRSMGVKLEGEFSEFLVTELIQYLEWSVEEAPSPIKKHHAFYDSHLIAVKSAHYGVLLWIGYESQHIISSREILTLKTIAEHVLSVCQTLDEYLQKNNALRQARGESEKKTSFLSQISHDIRSPLTTVQTVLELIIRDPTQATDAALVIGAQENVQIVKELVEDLVKFAQLKSDSMSADRSSVDLSALVASCVQSIRPMVENKKLTIQFVSDIELAQVFADPKHIKRILMNLLSNACKYTHGGGIAVHLYCQQNGSVCCSVMDTGIGLSLDSCAKLYRPFSRFSPEVDGVGLGLYISKGLCELNGVRLDVMSTLGEGSSFTLVFPPTVAKSEGALVIGATL